MHRHRERADKRRRAAKTVNCNKPGKEARWTGEAGGVPGGLFYTARSVRRTMIDNGMRVHMNELRYATHEAHGGASPDRGARPTGNTTYRAMWDAHAAIVGGSVHSRFIGEVTHDQTRWRDAVLKSKRHRRWHAAVNTMQ